ncbi:unnamed protein product [Owenia fusiformis]|uniref:Non-lysosomal glucosylceramidase n=1 Tax=Owenia fusiformis TaxID=6347 RepID=A0A8J1XV33_OWEFU|nr:unnamed protein product [Owenia fusiformis]
MLEGNSKDLPKDWRQISGVPDYGFRVKLNQKFEQKCGPMTIPRIHILPSLVGLTFRYIGYTLSRYRNGKRPYIDHNNLIKHKPMYGVPIGGIGCGTIGRGYKGEFCRFALIPGMYYWNEVDADQFIVNIRKRGQTVYQQVLSTKRPKGKGLNSWNWAYNGEFATYHGLYPRAWTVYELPGQNVTLVCRQISPVIPHDYKESTIPAAVFVWTVENRNSEPIDVSITFTFKNGQGSSQDLKGGAWNEPFVSNEEVADKTSGVLIHQKLKDNPCTMAISARHREGVRVSHCVAFDPKTPAKDLWYDLMQNGVLGQSTERSKETTKGKEIAGAVCAQCTVEANSSNYVELSLTWDMPVIHFANKGRLYCRRYCRWFGSEGDASPRLSSYALNNYPMWEKKIEEWQNPVLQNLNLPTWYKSALFNELYYVSDGGTVWVDIKQDPDYNKSDHIIENPLQEEYGKFAYLEGHEYRMYNTYDVHHYASFALAMLWPKLQISLQYDIANAIRMEDRTSVKFVMDGNKNLAKVKDMVPHDIGDPEDEPWLLNNAYHVHPTSEWKDLNIKFVLQVFRDYAGTKDEKYLKDMYPLAKDVMNNSLRWDTDDDGIIDNGGFADQTYDAWIVTGASAYCGGMWLSALKIMVEMAEKLDLPEDAQYFNAILEKGKVSFETKLWNGSYYNYDSSKAVYHDSVMSDQLAGHWFLKASGLPDDAVFPKENIHTALDTIYKHNILPFKNGTMGAINGMRPNGKKDLTSVQSEEFWTGVTYGLGATMIQEGKVEMGFQTAYGAYRTVYEDYGLAYQSPEAYMEGGYYRSLGYMRPLCIWSIQWALERFHPNILK